MEKEIRKMKMMKKIMMLLLVLMFVFAMTACGESDDSSSKKGSSRKKDDTEQNVTPTDDPDVTGEPTPTDDPGVTAIPDPTKAPDPTATPTPTPTEVPGPVLDGDLTYEFLAGKWSGSKEYDFVTFMKEMYGIDTSDEENAEYLAMFEYLTEAMAKQGLDSNMEIKFWVEFTSEEDITIGYSMDASKFAENLKKYLKNEDNLIAFIANVYGVDTSYVSTLLSMSGMTIDDLMGQIEEEYSEMADELSESNEDEDEYTINGNRIVCEDAGDCFYYDSNKGAIILDVPADEDDFKFLNGFAMKKER